MTERRREIILPDEEAERLLRRRTRRDFLIGGVAAAAVIGGYEWITHANQDDGEPWPERRVLELNGKIARGYLRDSHRMPLYSWDRVGSLKPNGDIGLDPSFDAKDWRLQVEGTGTQPLILSIADVINLPRVDMITKFCCIEGWSTIVQWTGARFSDFTRKYFPQRARLAQYVYMATPGEDYYVGLDMKSAMHPQTLLAYELNGKPLQNQHGAPLRLAIPVKYGIKNIKRIGLIRYTNEKPSDYWAEEGYDWFAGL